MKRKLILILFIIASAKLFSQPVIKNNSFENWGTFNSKQYPVDWDFDSIDVDKNILKRVSGGSQGSYAVHLGSANFSGDVLGSRIELYDSLLTTPGGLLFEYKIFNNSNTFLNGVFVEIYFYDKDGDYMKDYSADYHNNVSSFQTGGVNFSFGAEKPKYYMLSIEYFNFNGSTSEYTIVDNIRFTKPSGSVGSVQIPEVTFYPNPAKDLIQIANASENNLTKAKIISLDGKVSEFSIVNSSIDVSTLNNGFYLIELYDGDDHMLKREKISVINN